jgi:hypothetical protein
MPDYRLYFLDAQRHVRRRLDMECRDDAHAVAVIRECISDGPLELWEGARLVQVFDPAPDPRRPNSLSSAGKGAGSAGGDPSFESRSRDHPTSRQAPSL